MIHKTPFFLYPFFLARTFANASPGVPVAPIQVSLAPMMRILGWLTRAPSTVFLPVRIIYDPIRRYEYFRPKPLPYEVGLPPPQKKQPSKKIYCPNFWKVDG